MTAPVQGERRVSPLARTPASGQPWSSQTSALFWAILVLDTFRKGSAMERTLLEALVWLMPYMKPLAWTGAATVVLGVFLMALRKGRSAQRCALLGAALGLVFLAGHGLGMWVEVDLALRFDLSRRFRTMVLPFWQVGLGLLGPAAGVWTLSRSRMFAGA